MRCIIKNDDGAQTPIVVWLLYKKLVKCKYLDGSKGKFSFKLAFTPVWQGACKTRRRKAPHCVVSKYATGAHSRTITINLIIEKSSWKNQVWRTGFLVYFKLDFYCRCNLQKSISKLIFALDFSYLILQKSSRNE